MTVSNMSDLLVAELQEFRSVKRQLAQGLPGLARACHREDLRDFLDSEARRADHHAGRIGGLIEAEGADPAAHHDAVMEAMLSEARDWSQEVTDPSCLDAAIVASVQRIVHYEIAVSGTLAAWSEQTGREGSLEVLRGLAEEEKEADARLSALARESVNPEAA